MGTTDEALIEEEILADPAFSSLTTPETFRRFTETIGPVLTIGKPFQEALGTFDLKEQRIAKYSEAFDYYAGQSEKFVEMVKILRPQQEDSIKKVEDAIQLYGMDATRDLLIAIEMVQLVAKKSFEWKKTGQPVIAPSKVLKYADRAAENYGEGRSVHMAYAAGLAFDFLQFIVNQRGGENKTALTRFIEEVFNHGSRTGLIILNLARGITNLRNTENAFAAGLVHDIGQVVLAILDPNYIQFLHTTQGLDVPPAAQQVLERKRYLVDHAFYGSLLCNYFPPFGSFSEAILFHHQPFFLKSQAATKPYNLTSVVCLATNIARNWQEPSGKDDPIISEFWKRSEIKDYPISHEAIVKAVAPMFA